LIEEMVPHSVFIIISPIVNDFVILALCKKHFNTGNSKAISRMVFGSSFVGMEISRFVSSLENSCLNNDAFIIWNAEKSDLLNLKSGSKFSSAV
jgi:hypothetical protein